MMRFEIDNSTCIKAVSWETGELTLEFVGGSKFHYLTGLHVFQNFVRQVMEGTSAGTLYNTMLKGSFPGRAEGTEYQKYECTVFLAVTVKSSPHVTLPQLLSKVQNAASFSSSVDVEYVNWQSYDEGDLVDEYIN